MSDHARRGEPAVSDGSVRSSSRPRSLLALAAAVVALIVMVGSVAIVPAAAHHDDEPVQVVAKIRWGSSPAEVAADLDARLLDTLIGSRRVVLLETDDKDDTPVTIQRRTGSTGASGRTHRPDRRRAAGRGARRHAGLATRLRRLGYPGFERHRGRTGRCRHGPAGASP